MASQKGMPSSALRVLEEVLGMGSTAAGDTAEAVAAEGAYYLEQVTITETSEDDYEYEEIPDDNYSIPEGEEDLAKAVQIVQEQATDTQILEQKTVLSSKHAVPEAIEGFLCNFLIKMGMTRTLDCFQSECKAREDLLKTQKERDFHRMHHKRTVQEKDKLINDLKGLKLHYASYEPTIRVLYEKHHALLKQKMLTSLERDRAVGQISGLQETLKRMEIGHSFHAPEITVVPNCEKENAPEGPTQKGLREAREQSKRKTKMKVNTKASNRNQEGACELSARSALCPTPCLHHQEWRGNSQTWNKITPLQDIFGRRQQSAQALRVRPPVYRTSYLCQQEPKGRF
uniref:Sperm-associated antigen 16 protein isoform X4 n=1 Tax=Tursiops truncatus TaxID=9739 RepID=A0A6J3RNA0_TURTR|nr:sperm-associated antigen 16 protein isoform X4 [Tursiops truncatus]